MQGNQATTKRGLFLVASTSVILALVSLVVTSFAEGILGTKSVVQDSESDVVIKVEGGLGPASFFTHVAPGADFVKAGATTRTGPQTEPFTLDVPPLPPGGTVVTTYISWNYLLDGPPPPIDTIMVNGIPVEGQLVGTGTPDLCWGKEGAASYLALDPGSVVLGGLNTIAGSTDKALGSDPQALGEGLTILSVYETGTGPVRNVDLYAGYTSNQSETTSIATANFAFSNSYIGGGAHFFLNALDGQVASDDLFINNNLASGVVAGTVAAGDAWQGLLCPTAPDCYYDHANDIIAEPFLLPGAVGLTATTPDAIDCVGHSFGAISFEVDETPPPCEPCQIEAGLVAGTAEAAGGDTISVPIEARNAPTEVDSLGFEVHFDATKLAFSGCDFTGTFLENWTFKDCNSPQPGVVVVGGFTTDAGIPLGDSGPVVNLNFDVVACEEGQQCPLELMNFVDDIASWESCAGCFTCEPCDGDVNGDEQVTPADAQIVFGCFLGQGACTPTEVARGDINRDGSLTPEDAQCIFNKFLQRPPEEQCDCFLP